MFRKFIAAFVTILFAASIHMTVFAEFIPVDGDKSRNYIKEGFKAGDILRVEGFGAGPRNWDKNDSFYKTFARQAARMDSLRKFVEIFAGVQVEKDKKNPNIIRCRMLHESKVFKVLEKNARVIDVKFLDDGACQVTMELVFPADWKN